MSEVQRSPLRRQEGRPRSARPRDAGVSGRHEALPAPLGTGPRPTGRIKSDRFESRRFPKGSAVPTRRACERDEIITSRE